LGKNKDILPGVLLLIRATRAIRGHSPLVMEGRSTPLRLKPI
jgi:hypothetical protein